MNRSVLACLVMAPVLIGCGGTDGSADQGLELDEIELEVAESLGFIEVSVRVGDGDDATLISLAADRSSLDEIESADVALAEMLADCSGPNEVFAGAVDSGIIDDGYEIRVDAEAIAVTEGGATGFELSAPGRFEVETAVAVAFVVTTDDAEYRVTDGELILAEVINAGVFSGVDADGTPIDGAFLCG